MNLFQLPTFSLEKVNQHKLFRRACMEPLFFFLDAFGSHLNDAESIGVPKLEMVFIFGT